MISEYKSATRRNRPKGWTTFWSPSVSLVENDSYDKLVLHIHSYSKQPKDLYICACPIEKMYFNVSIYDKITLCNICNIHQSWSYHDPNRRIMEAALYCSTRLPPVLPWPTPQAKEGTTTYFGVIVVKYANSYDCLRFWVRLGTMLFFLQKPVGTFRVKK